MPARPLRLLPLIAVALSALLAGAARAADSVEERLRRLEAVVGDLREENAALRRELGRPAADKPAPAAAPAAPTLRLTGDVRFRYYSTMFKAPEAPTRDQFFDQLRMGFVFAPGEQWETGLRFTAGDINTGFAGNPLSAQFSVADNGSHKFVLIDQMFVRWKPSLGPDAKAAITFGKNENLFYVPSRILFDADYMPEGMTEEYSRQLSPRHRLWFAAGQYMLDDIASTAKDPWLLAGRARWDAQWDADWQTSLGAGQLRITNAATLTAANVPNNNRGNTRTAAGALAYDYRPFYFEATVTHLLDGMPGYAGKFPITFNADALHNPGAPANNNAWTAGLTLGKAGKAGQWEVGFRHHHVGADAWWEEMLDGDFGAYYRSVPPGWNTDPASLAGGFSGGTNLRSNVIRTSYSPYDYLLISANLFMNDLIKKIPAGTTDTAGKRFQFEGTVRF